MPIRRSTVGRTPQTAKPSTITSVSEWPRNDATRRFELGAQFGRVVDLAVIAEHEAAAARDHRLRSGRAEIDDGEPGMAERDARVGIDPHALIVGPAMAETVGHARRDGAQLIGPEASLQVYEARDPAHSRSFLPRAGTCRTKLPLSMAPRTTHPCNGSRASIAPCPAVTVRPRAMEFPPTRQGDSMSKRCIAAVLIAIATPAWRGVLLART